MGKIVVRNQPCLSDKCGSSDARQIYENGTSYCYSCRSFFPKNIKDIMKMPNSDAEFEEEGTVVVRKRKQDSDEDQEFVGNIFTIRDKYKSGPIKDRKISKTVCEFYGVKITYNNEGEPVEHYYPYQEGGNLAYKVRRLPKEFFSVGKIKGLFGRHLFSGGGKRLIITEGEIDALSVAQASYERYDKFYPIVSIRSSSTADRLLQYRDWLRSYDEVVIAFDNDEAGEKAKATAVKIIGVDKVKIAGYPPNCKDLNDVLLNHGSNSVLQCIWDAQKWVPSNIVGKDKLWEALANYNNIPSVPYPPCLEGINTKLKGMRLGEIALFISGTGSGKSTMLREIMLYLIETTDEKVGIVSLEESPAETARKLAGMAINRNPANEEISLDDLKVGFDAVFGDDRVLLLDHQGSISDGSIVEQLEYMALSGCNYIFVDHITILVSEGSEDLTGNAAIDKVMNDLLRLVKQHNIWIGLVSHLRKPPGGGKSFEEGKLPSIDDIRGSGSIKQISFDIISFARDLTAPNELIRNTIKMRILKSRYTGLTGTVNGARYFHETGRLTYSDQIQGEEFELVT